MLRQSADLLKPGTDDVRGTGLGTATGAAPVDRDAIGDKSVNGLGHIRQPGSAPVLAIRKDIQARPLLKLKGLENVPILDLAQPVQWQALFGVCGARPQQLGGAQEASDMIGFAAAGSSHVTLPVPHFVWSPAHLALFDSKHPDRAALGHLGKAAGSQPVELGLHALRVDAPARLHGNVLSAVDHE